jgi:multidrug efflux pump subunit AcrA (membrane-fusion protein)
MLRILFSISLLIFLTACDQEKAIHPIRKNIVEPVYASGKIISENEYTVFALTNGIVKEKLVKEGDTVMKGTILYEIKNESSLARVDAAKVNLENARSNLSPNSSVLNDLKITMQMADVKFKNDSLQYFRYKNLH